MRIFCKEKDYYDYLQVPDDDIIFDRRKYESWDSYDLIKKFPTYKKEAHFRYGKNRYQTLALRAGYKLFFFNIIITDIADNKMRGSFIDTSDFNYNVEYIGSKFDYEYKGDPLTFVCYDVDKGYDRKWNTIVADVLKENLNNLKSYSLRYNWWYHTENEEYYVPLLAKTFVSKYVSGDEIYNAVDDYLRSLNNDVDQESEGITDVDKAINHGFDKRTSFRNVK